MTEDLLAFRVEDHLGGHHHDLVLPRHVGVLLDPEVVDACLLAERRLQVLEDRLHVHARDAVLAPELDDEPRAGCEGGVELLRLERRDLRTGFGAGGRRGGLHRDGQSEHEAAAGKDCTH